MSGMKPRPYRLSEQGCARIVAARVGRPIAPETRAKISVAQQVRPPADEVAVMISLYPTASLRAIGFHVGYCRTVVRRALEEAGVPLRAPRQRLPRVRAHG